MTKRFRRAFLGIPEPKVDRRFGRRPGDQQLALPLVAASEFDEAGLGASCTVPSGEPEPCRIVYRLPLGPEARRLLSNLRERILLAFRQWSVTDGPMVIEDLPCPGQLTVDPLELRIIVILITAALAQTTRTREVARMTCFRTEFIQLVWRGVAEGGLGELRPDLWVADDGVLRIGDALSGDAGLIARTSELRVTRRGRLVAKPLVWIPEEFYLRFLFADAH